MGRQQRTKQPEPVPLHGSSAHPYAGKHTGKRKASLQARSAAGKPLPLKKKNVNGRGEKVGFNSGRDALNDNGRKAKKVRLSSGGGKKSKASADSLGSGADDQEENDDDSEDDLSGLRDEDEELGDEEDDDDQATLEAALEAEDAKGLEAARSALFGAEDLAPPIMLDSGEEDEDDEDEEDDEEDDDDEDMMDDEFDVVDGEEDEELVDGGKDAVNGVSLEDLEMTAAEAEQMPASGKKAAKRAARLALAANDFVTSEKTLTTKTKTAAKIDVASKPKEKRSTKSTDFVPQGAGAEELIDDEFLSGDDLEVEEEDQNDDDEEEENEEEEEEEEDEDAFDSDNELEEGTLEDLRAVERRMRNSARILGDWKKLGPATGKSRSDLVAQLTGDVCQYHGYTPYLAEKLIDLFGVEEAIQFFTTSDTPRPLTLRVNTLKTRRRDLAQALINRGVNLEPLEGGWSKVGLQVFSGGGVPVGATPEYLAGHYILQSASSFLPVIALSPQPHERVLDMSAAPGGKTTYMSALMGNTGEVWANDSSRGRIKGLGGNIARLGCKNVIVTNVDGREFPRIIGGFDRVLLDAPCSGTGVISKDQSVKVNKTERDFTLLSHLQKQLLLCAIDSVSPHSTTGGYVVYSTCSVTTEENESVVSYALRKRPHIKLVETGLAFGKEGFTTFRGKGFGKGDEMKLTRRFYPHVHNMDGFFVAKFKIGKPLKKSTLISEEADSDDLSLPTGPLAEENEASLSSRTKLDEDTITGFNEEEDAVLIEATKRKFAKKKGMNPKAMKGKAT